MSTRRTGLVWGYVRVAEGVTLGGEVPFLVSGQTRHGNRVEVTITLDEWGARRLAQDLLVAFKEIKELRDYQNKLNLSPYKDGGV